MTTPLMALDGLGKSYGSTRALRDVSLQIMAGRTHGLVGENGAGKSTLVKILSGAVLPDTGAIEFNGSAVAFASPTAAREAGVSTVFQELSSIPDMTLSENMQLQAPGRWRFGRRAREASARATAALWGVDVIPVDRPLGEMSLRDQQIAEILCAVARPARLLVLDEPTSALLPADVDWLHRLVQRFIDVNDGAVLFISHMFDEIERFCDTVHVQRNGVVVDTVGRDDFDRPRVIEQMIGRSLESAYPTRVAPPDAVERMLQVTDLSTRDGLHGVSFSLAAGEVVGIAGLDGQGQHQLFDALSGCGAVTEGGVHLRDTALRLSDPRHVLRPRRGAGVALVPAERKTRGAVLDWTVRKNTSMSVLRRVSRHGVIRDGAEDTLVRKLLDGVQVDPAKIDDPVSSLSGGNQQKVVFAKAIATDADVLLLFDATRGVDVGTKHEIYRLIADYASRGRAVLMYSTEIPELVNVCHRILVCYDGAIVAELVGEDISEHTVMAAAVGVGR